MNYDFGDILDARNVPSIGHFILVVGQITRKDSVTNREITEVMYYIITSRVYAVFKNILLYFNDCLSRGDRHFLRHFGKEKDKTYISAHGHLSQAFFLDKETNYDSCLDTESMVVINSEPYLLDKTALETLKMDGKIVYKNKLVKLDAKHLIETIKCSNDVSNFKKVKISMCFNAIKALLK